MASAVVTGIVIGAVVFTYHILRLNAKERRRKARRESRQG